MQNNELKAVLAKTNEVAVYPVNVEDDLPNSTHRLHGQVVCPTGLVRARVLKNGVKWIERRQIAACTTEDYEIERRNGVLVEFDRTDLIKTHRRNLKFILKNNKIYLDSRPYPHTEVKEDDNGGYVIQMVISRKAIITDWDNYALIEAARQKEHEEYERKRLALLEPQATIMGLSPEEFEEKFVDNDTREYPELYLHAQWKEIPKRDKEGDVVYTDNTYRHRVIDHEVGIITITLNQAEKILNMLTDEQKAALRNA